MTNLLHVPDLVPNEFAAGSAPARSGRTVDKLDPHTGAVLWRLARSEAVDVAQAVSEAIATQEHWAATSPVERGRILHAVADALVEHADDLGRIVSAETGKSPREAAGEVAATVAVGRFFAGEGQRLYGRTTTSGAINRYAMTVRQPVGVAGLVIAANTPLANVGWKVFPALICGNAAVLKAAEDTPATAWAFAQVARLAGLPNGVLCTVQGLGAEAGAPLVADERVGVVSFTGSVGVGREIAQVAGRRLAKVSLELGGRNPFVVCDDADIDRAVEWAVLSAFSNAGQRCASGSRLIVMAGVYDGFREKLLGRIGEMRLGPRDEDDLGPVINERAMNRILALVDEARQAGATVSTGGSRLEDDEHARGYYVAPTVVEDVPSDTGLATNEIFGPVTVLHRVPDFASALEEANCSQYGLTACVHTTNWDRAMQFAMHVRAGVASVNGGTFGSEPHMPFGGLGASGNGSREPGTEALDVYTELKDLYLSVDPSRLDA